MKKIIFGLLMAFLPFALPTANAQMTIPSRPSPPKQTYIVSTVEGKLFYTVYKGKRTNFRVPREQIPASPLPPKVVCVFNKNWFVPPEEQIVTQPKRDTNDFAELLVKFNKERRHLKWLIGAGEEIVYLFQSSRTGECVQVGTKNGMLDYIIRRGKRENYRVEPVPQAQQVIYRPVYLWYDAYEAAVAGQARQRKTKKIESQGATKSKENDFALLEQKLRQGGWRIKAMTTNNQELIYYYEK